MCTCTFYVHNIFLDETCAAAEQDAASEKYMYVNWGRDNERK